MHASLSDTVSFYKSAVSVNIYSRRNALSADATLLWIQNLYTKAHKYAVILIYLAARETAKKINIR